MIGVKIIEGNSNFSVWAPEKEKMILHIISPGEQEIEMQKDEDGYFTTVVNNITDGARYFYKPDGDKDYPDPASHFQPDGVHGPSQVVDHSKFIWNDQDWKGIPLKEMIFCEIHVGTFTSEGTFEAMIPMLDELSSTGINAIELMPVAQFPGKRNWGYDGVYSYSVQNSYGGPHGLKKLVDACHLKGIAVFLDVVYNHLGPEGNYFSIFAPYFTERYRVPWGNAINLDDAWSDGSREYFSGNPGHWRLNYHIDGLRVDAIHMMFDSGAVNFWTLTRGKIDEVEQKTGRRFYIIAESDSNNPAVVKSTDCGGNGFDAQWLDDFHHALYVLLHKEGKSRYEDFGKTEQLLKAYSDGFVHSGEIVKFRRRRHGASSAGIPGEKFIVFNSNHDQVGNRVNGERLSVLVDFELQKVASAAILLSPYIPLFFMGEEYGEDNPFFYFIDHSDQELVTAAREGRKKEFEEFMWVTEPPDPQDESTFIKSRIDWNKRFSGNYKTLLDWNKKLIEFRRSDTALQNTIKNGLFIYSNQEHGFILGRKSEDGHHNIFCFFNLSEDDIIFNVPSQSGTSFKIIDSGDMAWNKKDNREDRSSPSEIEADQKLTIHAASVVVYGNEVKI